MCVCVCFACSFMPVCQDEIESVLVLKWSFTDRVPVKDSFEPLLIR